MDKEAILLKIYQQDLAKIQRLWKKPLNLWGRKNLFRDPEAEYKRIKEQERMNPKPKTKLELMKAAEIADKARLAKNRK